jgi:hypothetical protein
MRVEGAPAFGPRQRPVRTFGRATRRAEHREKPEACARKPHTGAAISRFTPPPGMSLRGHRFSTFALKRRAYGATKKAQAFTATALGGLIYALLWPQLGQFIRLAWTMTIREWRTQPP